MPDLIYPAQAAAANMQRLRKLRRLSQDDVAQRMTALGYGRGGKPGGRPEERAGAWNRSTTGEVERGVRELTTNELVGLSLILGVTLGELLDPGDKRLYLGDTLPPEIIGQDIGEDVEPAPSIRAAVAREWFRSRMRAELVEVEPNRLRTRFLPVGGWTDELLDAVGVRVERVPGRRKRAQH